MRKNVPLVYRIAERKVKKEPRARAEGQMGRRLSGVDHLGRRRERGGRVTDLAERQLGVRRRRKAALAGAPHLFVVDGTGRLAVGSAAIEGVRGSGHVDLLLVGRLEIISPSLFFVNAGWSDNHFFGIVKK